MDGKNGTFQAFMTDVEQKGELVVQPRMGFADPETMYLGLLATRNAVGFTCGTLTLDSFTRLGLFGDAQAALEAGEPLNGYPIVSHGGVLTRELLDGLAGADFPVQVRHGSPQPYEIFQAAAAAGIDATEGGPISYCLPYGRIPLTRAVAAWDEALRLWAGHSAQIGGTHVETFAGCMMGQLCPPSMLIALSVLEGRFIEHAGVPSLSLSYSQGTCAAQDVAALRVLDELGARYLGDVQRHQVLYSFMGLFPESPQGAQAILEDSARIAVQGGARRLIVKTTVEASQIPTIDDNVRALEIAARAAKDAQPIVDARCVEAFTQEIREEAVTLIDAVLNEHQDLGLALSRSFERGLLDVPFCIHEDNPNRARPVLRSDGSLGWASVGSLPLKMPAATDGAQSFTACELLRALSYNRERYDGVAG